MRVEGGYDDVAAGQNEVRGGYDESGSWLK